MPQETKSDVDRGPEEIWTRGVRVEAGDPNLPRAIEMAVNYRGDVTITRIGDGGTVEGFLFDYRPHEDPGVARVRMIPNGSDERVAIPLTDIAAVEFTGRDTAAGRSFETWMRKYVRKKLAGEEASIKSEALDGE